MQAFILFLLLTFRLFASTIVTENDPATLVEGLVSVITGDLYLAEEDIVIEGAEPLHLKRHFITKSWNISFFQHLFAFYFPKEKGLTIYEANGSQLNFLKPKGKQDFELLSYHHLPGVSNTARGRISALSSLKNQRIRFSGDTFSLLLPNGTARHYRKSDWKDFDDRVRYILLSEELPNGNKIVYDYEARQFVGMRTTNPSGTKTYAQARFHYTPRDNRVDFDIITSDGRKLQYRTKPFLFKNKKINGACFECILSPEYPDESFEYTDIDGAPHLTRVALPNGRRFSIKYDSKGRVKQLLSPTDAVTHTFTYFSEKDRRTDVTDSAGDTTRYFWSEEKRLIRIERYTKAGALYNSERLGWADNESLDAGCLLFRTFYDSDKPLFSRSYKYDLHSNISEETFWGNLSGHGILEVASDGRPTRGETYKKYINYDGRQNIWSEWEENGKMVQYRYLPNTNLCNYQLTEQVFKPGTQQRRFVFYNSDNVPIREIEDNGCSEDPNDLAHVNQRTIKEIRLIEEGPYLNMPHSIEEKYWDGTQERFLKRTVFTYTTGGNVTQQEVFHEGVQYTLHTEYDEKGRPTKETNALGQIAFSKYDENGNKIFFQDFSGSIKHMDYDLSNHLIAVTEGDRKTLHTYDAKGNKIQTTDFRGHKTEYVYDSSGHLVETRLPLGDRLKKTYDGAGRETSSTDAKGNTTRKRYNAYGVPIEISYPDGSKEQFTYKIDGTLKTHVNQVGVVSHYTHDTQKRLLSKIVEGHEEHYVYDVYHLNSKTDAEGNTTQYSYDHAGRKIAEVFDGRRIVYRHDALSRVSEIQQGDLVTLKIYDLQSRVLSEKKQSLDGTVLAHEEYAYDAAGNQIAHIRYPHNQKAQETSLYDAFNRLVQKTDALGYQTTITYDDIYQNAQGHRVLQKTTQDPLGNLTIETNDPKDRLVSCAKKNTQGQLLSLEEYFYDSNDNLCHQQSSVFSAGALERQVTTLWHYDSMNRLITLTEASGTPEEKTTSHTYTPKGLLAQKTKPDDTTLTHTYDSFDNCIETRSSDGTIHYTFHYNAIGVLLSSTDQLTGLTTQKHYNASGQLLHELLANGLSLTSTYDTRGRRISLTLPDNTWIEYTYDPLYLRSITRHQQNTRYTHRFTHYDLAENPLEEELIHSLGTLHYQIDPLGRKFSTTCPYYTQRVLAFDPVGNILSMQLPEETVYYTYDDLYQLTEETGLFAHTYSYDSHLNRTRKDDESYWINSLNQNPTCTYDPNGNPLSHRFWRMQYDALDRLICIEGLKQRLTFTYDADHRRLSKQLYTKQNDQWVLEQHLSFLYDGQNEIGSLNDQNAFQELRILGRTPHAEIGSAIAIELNNTLYAPIHDLQGSLCTLVPINNPQNPERYRYSAFGEEQAPVPLCPWRFSSKRTDESSLVYFGRRYYSPTLGRWLTPDPIGLSAGINLYAYVSNDPLTKLDDYGLLEVYWDSYLGRSPQDTRPISMGLIYGAKDFMINNAFFCVRSSPVISYAAHTLLSYTNRYASESWNIFQPGGEEFFHRLTDNWMQRYLPADINNPNFHGSRIVSNAACTFMPLAFNAVNIATSACTLSLRGLSNLRTMMNSKQAQQSLKIFSQDLKRVDRGLRSAAPRSLFNFTDTAARHMNEVERRIPMHILHDVVRFPIAVAKDPKATSNAMMYYSQMWKNGKSYNVEVLYDEANNTILHFLYTKDPVGPLKKIPKIPG